MTVAIDAKEYLPAAAAAAQLATTEMKILMLLKKGALNGDLIDGSWYVTASSLASYRPEVIDPGAGSQCRTSCGGSGCGLH